MVEGYYPVERLKTFMRRSFLNAGLISPHGIDLTQTDGTIHIFTDGSYSQKTKRLGYAAIIKTKTPDDELVLYDNRKRAKTPQGHIISEDIQNIAAELYAVIEGLDALPENSDVIVHTDFMETEAYLNLHILNDTYANKKFRDIWADLEKAQNRHRRVRATRATDNDKTENFEHRRLMRLAHNFSVTGSGSSNMKPFLTHQDETKYLSFIDNVAYAAINTHRGGSTPGALDIYDNGTDTGIEEWPSQSEMGEPP